MSSILRIKSHRSAPLARTEPDPAKAYLERLVKLIPAEVVALYLAGAGAIKAAFPGAAAGSVPVSEQAYWWGWTIFCFAAVILVRAWATSSRPEKLAPEWPAVGIAAISFVIWVYSLGDAFDRVGWWEPLLATLLVLAWTFVIPLVYRETQGAAEGARPSTGRSARTAPADFSLGDAEKAVLDAAEWLSGQRPSLMHLVSKYFDTTNRVRRMLARTQDLIRERHGIWVELADGSEAEMTDHGDKVFGALALWIFDEVRALPAGAAR